MKLKLEHVCVALLIIVVILAIVRLATPQSEAESACERTCAERGLDSWYYDAHADKCWCNTLDPV